MCGNTLSGPVPVVALVSRYLTNKLIGLGSLHEREVPKDPRFLPDRMPHRDHMRY